jgi:RNA polymerase sigma-70 factor, ECF subfamily
MMGSSDEQLMRLVQHGEERALEILLDRHAQSAMSLARRFAGRYGVAEDVAQEAFLSLWRRSASYREDRGDVRGWLLAIVRNRALTETRREGLRERRSAGLETIEASAPAPVDTEGDVVLREQAAATRRALASLPAHHQQVLELSYFEGLSQTEIAARTQLPLGTVKSRTRLALERLRRRLEEAGAVP